MADTQTLATLQEVLLNVRIAFTTGSEAEWTSANPVLKMGEIGFVENTYPAKFKIGDGTKTWSALGWGNVTTLAQLTADATHRLVTDAEKATWNARARIIRFNYPASQSADAEISNPQKAIVKEIVRAVNAGENVIVFAEDVNPPTTYREHVSGIVELGTVTSTEVRGLIKDFAYDSNTDDDTIYLFTALLTFKSDGTAAVELIESTPELLTVSGGDIAVQAAIDEFKASAFILQCTIPGM